MGTVRISTNLNRTRDFLKKDGTIEHREVAKKVPSGLKETKEETKEQKKARLLKELAELE